MLNYENETNRATIEWLYSRLLRREVYWDADKNEKELAEYKEKLSAFSQLEFKDKIKEYLELCKEKCTINYLEYGDDHKFNLEVEKYLDDDEDPEEIGKDLHDIEIMVSDEFREAQEYTVETNLNYLLELECESWVKVALFEGMLSLGDEYQGKSEKRTALTIKDFIGLDELDIEEDKKFLSNELSGHPIDDETLDKLLADFAFGKYWDSQRIQSNTKNYH